EAGRRPLPPAETAPLSCGMFRRITTRGGRTGSREQPRPPGPSPGRQNSRVRGRTGLRAGPLPQCGALGQRLVTQPCLEADHALAQRLVAGGEDPDREQARVARPPPPATGAPGRPPAAPRRTGGDPGPPGGAGGRAPPTPGGGAPAPSTRGGGPAPPAPARTPRSPRPAASEP